MFASLIQGVSSSAVIPRPVPPAAVARLHWEHRHQGEAPCSVQTGTNLQDAQDQTPPHGSHCCYHKEGNKAQHMVSTSLNRAAELQQELTLTLRHCRVDLDKFSIPLLTEFKRNKPGYDKTLHNNTAMACNKWCTSILHKQQSTRKCISQGQESLQRSMMPT
jgi:hypothetical protein